MATEDAGAEFTPQTDSPKAKGRSGAPIRRAIFGVLLIVALTGAAIVGWTWWTTWRFIESTDDAYVKADIVTVAPQVAGAVAIVAVDDNQMVAAGDPLFTLDDADYQAVLDATQAAFDQAEAALAVNREQRVLQLRTIDVSETDLAAARATFDFAKAERERYTRLARQGAGTERARQQAEEGFRNAEAAVNKSKAALAQQHQQLAVIEAERTSLEKQRDQTRARLRTAQIDLNYTRVSAPVAGRIGNRQVEVGEFLQPGSQALAIVPVRSYVVANFKETQIEHFSPGMTVEVEADVLGGATVRGTIDSLSPAAGAEFAILPPQNATGNFTKIVQRVPVKIVFDPDNAQARRLTPGTSVTVSVDTKDARP